ncbi:MAG: hypothetical protein GPJ54_15985 [Candidatus Heimdallarchaeota archaeon]|nr:hypothetical protein [Candidatus Heimdallarchaeota archaeon]
MVTTGLLYQVNTNSDEILNPVGGVDRPYYFRIELSQWSIKVIDLNRIEDLMLEGNSLSFAYSQSTYLDYMGKLEKGSKVFFQVYSLDVQHGFLINELDIHISILESTENIDSTIPYFYDFTLPDTDISISAYCQVYCGLGHSNMKIRFDVGHGVPNNGINWFNFYLIFNPLIVILFIFLIYSPIKRKVYLIERSPTSSKPSLEKELILDLYDISNFNEKEIVSLRLGHLDVRKRGLLINTFKSLTLQELTQQIKSNQLGDKWKLIDFND